jgi:hypothetical protein
MIPLPAGRAAGFPVRHAAPQADQGRIAGERILKQRQDGSGSGCWIELPPTLATFDANPSLPRYSSGA